MNEKRGMFLVVLLLVSLLFSVLFFSVPVIAAAGCYTYPQASEDLYCVPGILDTEAQADCNEHPDCRMSQYFIPGSSCQELPECTSVTCSADCQTHALGVCEQLGGTEVPADRYDEMCTPGCCKISNVFCQFGLNKFQCEQRARQLGRTPSLPDTIFDNPLGMDVQRCNTDYCGVSVQPGTLSGRILNQEGQGIAAARITLEGTNVETNSAVDGSYSFLSLTPGTFFVQVQAAGYVQASVTISLSPGGSVQRDFTLVASADLAEVLGTVRREDNTPLRSATIRWTGPVSAQTTTNERGEYQATGLPIGSYVFTASKVGFRSVEQTLSIDAAGRISPVDFTLAESTVQGVAGTTLVEGHATYGVRVYVDGIFKGYSQYPDGRFQVTLDVQQDDEPHAISAAYQDYQFEGNFRASPGRTIFKDLSLTRYIGECTPPNPPQAVGEFLVQHVPGKKQAKLQWQKPCPEVIGYLIQKDGADFRSASPSQSFLIDTEVEWEGTHTYSIIAQYGLGSRSEPVSFTFTLGQHQCEDKYHEDTGWETFCLVGEAETRKTVWTCDSQNHLRASLPCRERDGGGQDFYCAPVTLRNADCKDAGICSNPTNTGLFGLYASSEQCYGTNTPDRGTSNYCYYDYTDSIANKCKRCAGDEEQVESCFDYKSKDACAINSCLSSRCQWIDAASNDEPIVNYGLISLPGVVTPETGHGYCVEQEYTQDDACARCGPASPPSSLFENYYCTANICSGLGRCFSNSALSSCASCGDAASRTANCYTYATELECTAGQGISRTALGSISLSHDRCTWGRCAWTGEANGFASGACVKDGDADSVDDCSEFQASGERLACTIDNSPPKTNVMTAGINILSRAHPEITFHGDDGFHLSAGQRNKLGVLGYCLTSADPQVPDACTSFTETAYPGRTPDEMVTVNLLESPSVQRRIDGEPYRLKFYSKDKYHNQEEVQSAFIFIDNQPPQFDINQQIETVEDHTSLAVYLEGLSEPASCDFSLMQLLPAGTTQLQSVSRVQQEKRVTFENLPGILYDLTVSCTDDQDNVGSQNKAYTFDLEKRIDIVNPPLQGAVSRIDISFEATTVTGAQCRLFTAANVPVADFVSNEQGKEHHTAAVSGFTERAYPAEYKIVCQDLLTPEEYEDYFDFTVDFTPPTTQAVLREGLREEQPLDFGWKEYFVQSVTVDFECAADGFACDKTFYCLGAGCELLSNPQYREYTSSVELNRSTRLCYYSTDVAQNRVYAPQCGDILIEGYGVTLENPKPHYYHEEQWGVSNTPTFDWKFFTKVPTAECRFDFVSGFSYAASPGFKVLTPDAGETYVVPFFPSGTGSSPYPDRGGVKQIYVQCRNLAQEIGPEQKLNLEYDPTTPEITDARADPEILMEGNRVDVIVNTDDKTLCKYSDSGQTGYELMSYAFPGAEADLPGARTDTRRVIQEQHRSEYYIGNFRGLTQEFTLTTQCKNAAGDLSEVKTITFLVDYTRQGGIASVWPDGDSLDTPEVTVRTETTKNALCQLTDNGTVASMEGAGGKAHTLRKLTPAEKNYRYPIHCRMGDHTAEALSTFTIDRTAPIITLVQDGNYTCGNEVHLFVSTTEENLSAYYYELYQDDSRYASTAGGAASSFVPASASGLSSLGPSSFGNRSVASDLRGSTESLPPSGVFISNQTVGPNQPLTIIIPGVAESEGNNGVNGTNGMDSTTNSTTRYVARVKARDLAGHWSRFVNSDGVLFSSPNDSVCRRDTAPPEVEVILNESCTASWAELHCTDAIGCRNFRYGKDATSACTPNQNYLGQKISFAQSGWLCYYLEDSNGNNHTGKRQVTVADTDGDGITNGCDQCRATGAGKMADERGCADGEVPEGEEDIDTDHDGLPDFWEKVYAADDCALNYASPDSDDNGVSDREEDYDEDGMSNYEEYTGHYHPCLADAPSVPPARPTIPTLPLSEGEKSSLLAWVLLIVGLMLILGGSGYLIYYYRKYPPGKMPTAVAGVSRKEAAGVSAVESPGLWNKIFQLRKASREKAQQRQRAEVFGQFRKDSSVIPHIDPLLSSGKAELPQLQAVARRYAEHKEEIKPGLRPDEKSIFSKLESIAEQTKEKKIHQVVSAAEAKDLFAKLRRISSKRKK